MNPNPGESNLINNDYLFVYGTLRRSANSKMSQLLARNAVFIDYAVFQGRLYKIDYYPGAVPSNDPGHRVSGEVYLLADAESLLPRLDRYEGCGLEFPEPNEYRRQQREVLLNNGLIRSAWIYLYNRATTGLELIE